jgi:DNA-binding Xre family transcriptional regulator
MKIRESLIQALDRFDVRSKTLADASGLSQSQLSHFRSGRKGLEIENLEKLIDVLEPEVQLYFCSLLAGSTLDLTGAEQFIAALNPEKLGRALNANRDLLVKALAYLERDVRADMMSRVIELYRSESASEKSKEPVACR